jgi:hypothetical protein
MCAHIKSHPIKMHYLYTDSVFLLYVVWSIVIGISNVVLNVGLELVQGLSNICMQSVFEVTAMTKQV